MSPLNGINVTQTSLYVAKKLQEKHKSIVLCSVFKSLIRQGHTFNKIILYLSMCPTGQGLRYIWCKSKWIWDQQCSSLQPRDKSLEPGLQWCHLLENLGQCSPCAKEVVSRFFLSRNWRQGIYFFHPLIPRVNNLFEKCREESKIESCTHIKKWS